MHAHAGVTSGVLAARGINAAATQSLLNYALLTVVCGAVHARRSRELQQSQQGEGGGGKAWTLPPRSNPWYVYCLLALMDVEANYLVTKVGCSACASCVYRRNSVMD